MTTFVQTWLTEEEVLFHRMESFHRQRVEAIASGQSPLVMREGGILVVHLIPRSCVQGRTLFDGAKLKEHGGSVPPLGGRGGYVRFNVDGLLNYDGHKEIRSYSQLFRDGRLEAVMPEVAFPLDRQQKNSVHCLRDSICEDAVFNTVAGYLRFCKAIGLDAPVQMFSVLVGCEGVRICTDTGFRDVSDHAIDRSPAFLPCIDITSLDAEPKALLTPLVRHSLAGVRHGEVVQLRCRRKLAGAETITASAPMVAWAGVFDDLKKTLRGLFDFRPQMQQETRLAGE